MSVKKLLLAEETSSDFEPVKFTVDAALLRELGERLVGRPEIALAELVKNAYDADGRICTISFEDGAIEIVDDGHGMSEAEFKEFWMRVGTTIKQRETISRKLGRPVTGSKGVGRLAVQFLASELELTTTSDEDTTHKLQAFIDWGKAQEATHLTEATAMYRVTARDETYANGSIHGTRIRLGGIRQAWGTESIRELAQELWFLQPPYKHPGGTEEYGKECDPKSFAIDLITPNENLAEVFEEQMRAALSNWQARITGGVEDGRDTGIVRVKIEFSGGEIFEETFDITDKETPRSCIDEIDFEILVFKLSGRQSHGVSVHEARDYFKQFGGIHVYDSGFRLPYYGIEQDWLGIEMDHSHRIHKSSLLPDKLQVFRGLQDLPSLGRIYGVVNINTSHESQVAEEANGDDQYLVPQISRDRLVDNDAYRQLKRAVRVAVDYYATRVRVRRYREWEMDRYLIEPAERIDRVRKVLVSYEREIPDTVFTELSTRIEDAVAAEKAAQRSSEEEKALLGALASAGMAALALEHEVGKELTELDNLIEDLEVRAAASNFEELEGIISALKSWSNRVRDTRRIFSPLMDEGSRKTAQRYKAGATISQVKRNMRSLLRDIDVDVRGVAKDLRLPSATMADWNAIFQNVFINAVNAMLDATDRRIVCQGGIVGETAYLTVSDTGVGIDLSDAEDLFKPFERRLEISDERKALELGGRGLGLTIVRLIADAIGCTTSFVEPEEPFATTFKLTWEHENAH